MKKEAIELLQYRIAQEELSSRIYEQMSLWLNNNGFAGSAKLWAKYASEEMEHAEWSKNYLLSFGITPELRKLDAPVNKYDCLVDIINASFLHEETITLQCNELAAKAHEIGDYNLVTLALKYCDEQINEMNKVINNQDLIKRFGTSKEALLLIDNKLGDI